MVNPNVIKVVTRGPQGATGDTGATGASGGDECFLMACSDEVTPIPALPAVVVFRMPYAFTLSGVRASLTTQQSSGDILTIDINQDGSSILSTKLTIDNGEKTSVTAATSAVLSDTALADDAEITIDVDQVGSSADAVGLKVSLIGTKAA
jgi:hypothetical protein